MVEAVAFHHTPGLVTAGERDVLTAIHAAGALVEIASAESADRPQLDAVDESFLESVGRMADLPAWRALAREEVRVGSTAPSS
jgi:hypothetical protein